MCLRAKKVGFIGVLTNGTPYEPDESFGYSEEQCFNNIVGRMINNAIKQRKEKAFRDVLINLTREQLRDEMGIVIRPIYLMGDGSGE